MDEITIIVNSCDAYADVWPPFFASLREMWPDLRYSILLNTESKSYLYSGLNITTLGPDAEYSNQVEPWWHRLLRHLNSIDSEYVLMLFDDYIVEEPVNGIKIEQCKAWLKSDDTIGAFYLVQGGFNLTLDTQYQLFSLVRPRSDYIVNSAPALWNKHLLESFVGKIDTPWAWEYFGSARAYRQNIKFYSIKDKHYEIYKYQYERGGAIHQGKWVKAVIAPVIERYSLQIDCSKRGFDEEILKKRKPSWYFQFYLTGWRMVKWDVFVFINRALFRLAKRMLRKLFLTK